MKAQGLALKSIFKSHAFYSNSTSPQCNTANEDLSSRYQNPESIKQLAKIPFKCRKNVEKVPTKRKSSEHQTSSQPASDCPRLSTSTSAIPFAHLARYLPHPRYWRRSFESSRFVLIPFVLIGRKCHRVLRSSARWLRLLRLFAGYMYFVVEPPPSLIAADHQLDSDSTGLGQDQANLELVCCIMDLRIGLLMELYVR